MNNNKKECRKVGRPTDKKKDDYIKARVPKDYKSKLKKFCKENNIDSISTLIVQSIDMFINEKSK